MAEAKLKARVLVDHGGHRVNDVVEGADAEAGIAEGWADGSADAVKRAATEKRLAAKKAD